MNNSEAWYIVKRSQGTCEIQSYPPSGNNSAESRDVVEHWGPFASEAEAIARRVGLIRAGKCQPI